MDLAWISCTLGRKYFLKKIFVFSLDIILYNLRLFSPLELMVNVYK